MQTLYDGLWKKTDPKQTLTYILDNVFKTKRTDGSFFEKDIPYTPVELCDDIFDPTTRDKPAPLGVGPVRLDKKYPPLETGNK